MWTKCLRSEHCMGHIPGHVPTEPRFSRLPHTYVNINIQLPPHSTILILWGIPKRNNFGPKLVNIGTLEADL